MEGIMPYGTATWLHSGTEDVQINESNGSCYTCQNKCESQSHGVQKSLFLKSIFCSPPGQPLHCHSLCLSLAVCKKTLS